MEEEEGEKLRVTVPSRLNRVLGLYTFSVTDGSQYRKKEKKKGLKGKGGKKERERQRIRISCLSSPRSNPVAERGDGERVRETTEGEGEKKRRSPVAPDSAQALAGCRSLQERKKDLGRERKKKKMSKRGSCGVWAGLSCPAADSMRGSAEEKGSRKKKKGEVGGRRKAVTDVSTGPLNFC